MQTYLGNLGIPEDTHPNDSMIDVYGHAKNKLHHSLLSYDITF